VMQHNLRKSGKRAGLTVTENNDNSHHNL